TATASILRVFIFSSTNLRNGNTKRPGIAKQRIPAFYFLLFSLEKNENSAWEPNALGRRTYRLEQRARKNTDVFRRGHSILPSVIQMRFIGCQDKKLLKLYRDDRLL